jgi:type II secretory pathway pseudopilin PulG
VVSKHTKRGYAGIALGVVLVIIAFVLGLTGPRRRRALR